MTKIECSGNDLITVNKELHEAAWYNKMDMSSRKWFMMAKKFENMKEECENMDWTMKNKLIDFLVKCGI
jgi:ribosomal protein L14E/L6E/L27E